MRIIGGKFRSRVLAEFDGMEVRPTADRVKESLFNILSVRLIGARVLDLFCGSGALGLESLSRGAAQAVFNDSSRASIAILEKNMRTLKIEKGRDAEVYNLDYAACLDVVRGKFDFIFIDPPYRFDYGVPALEKIGKRGLLSENGIVVYERDRAFEGEVEGFEKFDERKYGKTYVTFFRLKG